MKIVNFYKRAGNVKKSALSTVDNARDLLAGDEHPLTVFKIPSAAAGIQQTGDFGINHKPQLKLLVCTDFGEIKPDGNICFINTDGITIAESNGLGCQNGVTPAQFDTGIVNGWFVLPAILCVISMLILIFGYRINNDVLAQAQKEIAERQDNE